MIKRSICEEASKTFADVIFFTVECLGTRPMPASEAGVDLALIQTCLLFSCKCGLVRMTTN